MKRKAFFAIAVLGLMSAMGQAQDNLPKEQWSLEQCINYAHENNISIKRQDLNAQYQENVLKQSRLDRLPDLNADVSTTTQNGLVTGYDSEGNYYSNDQNSNNIYPSVTSRVTIFEGLAKKHEIKKNEYKLLSAQHEVEQVENDITLQLTHQFLQVLLYKELLAVAQEQYEVSKLQMERTKKLVDAGSQAMGSYLEIKSQAAKEALNVAQQENNLGISLLNLAQILDLESPIGFDVQSPKLPEMGIFAADLPRDIFTTSVDIMPEIKRTEYNVKSKEHELKEVKGAYYPKLYANGRWSSSANFYNNNDDPSFGDQISDRRVYSLGFTLQIPIFNRFQFRNNVNNTKISLRDAQYQLEEEKLNLRKDIQQAYADALASYKKYQASEEAVDSYKESFRYTEKKFNVGLVNSVDYNVAKTDFTRAQSDLLQAKYEYVLRTKILDFYKGIPITL